MKYPTLILIAIIAYLLAVVPADAQDIVAPTIKIGSGAVEAGSGVRIPITLDNHRDFIALQFDIVFEPSIFAKVDTSQCLSQLPTSRFLADCRRQDPPTTTWCGLWFLVGISSRFHLACWAILTSMRLLVRFPAFHRFPHWSAPAWAFHRTSRPSA